MHEIKIVELLMLKDEGEISKQTLKNNYFFYHEEGECIEINNSETGQYYYLKKDNFLIKTHHTFQVDEDTLAQIRMAIFFKKKTKGNRPFILINRVSAIDALEYEEITNDILIGKTPYNNNSKADIYFFKRVVTFNDIHYYHYMSDMVINDEKQKIMWVGNLKENEKDIYSKQIIENYR
jgi:hypothetical protein